MPTGFCDFEGHWPDRVKILLRNEQGLIFWPFLVDLIEKAFQTKVSASYTINHTLRPVKIVPSSCCLPTDWGTSIDISQIGNFVRQFDEFCLVCERWGVVDLQ